MNRISREAGIPEKHSVSQQDNIVDQVLPPETGTCYANDWKTKNDKCTQA